MTGVWLAAPVTEGLTLLLSLLFIHKEKNRIHAEQGFLAYDKDALKNSP
jgi:hypothetical protein